MPNDPGKHMPGCTLGAKYIDGHETESVGGQSVHISEGPPPWPVDDDDQDPCKNP